VARLSVEKLTLFFFILRFYFCHGPKGLKKVCYPSPRLSIAVISLSEKEEQSVSNSPALWVVIAAKESGIPRVFLLEDNTLKWSLHVHCSMAITAAINFCIEAKNNIKEAVVTC
jgi:hypothetical protein